VKIAIISDVHNNTTNLGKILEYCKKNKIGTIICPGDLSNMETLDFLSDNFSGIIHYTPGNADQDQMRIDKLPDKYKNVSVHKEFGTLVVKNKNSSKHVAFVHFPDIAKKLCAPGKYDYVFYGHTHKPWMETINNCIMLNPGTAAGIFYPPTFAVWDTEKNSFELIRVHDLDKTKGPAE